MTTNNQAAAFAVAALGIALFSAMDAIMKGLSIEIGAYNAMLWRSVIGVLLGGGAYLLRRGRWPGPAALRLHVWRGLTAGASVLLFFWGLARIPIAQGVALSFISPLIALFLAGLFLKERIGRTAVAASLLAFLGVLVILAGQADADMGAEAMRGAAAILVSAVLYAISLIIARRQSQAAGPLEIGVFFNIVGFGLYLTGAPWLAVLPEVRHLPGLLMSAIFSFVSIMLLAWAYARAEAQYLLPVEYTAFVWAALLGWWVFGEQVLPTTIAGAAMIVAGCLWAARRRPAASPVTEAAL